jgi:hypothetical protein
MQPGHTDSIPDPKSLYASPDAFHDSHNLMSGRDRSFAQWQIALDDVQIGMAHAAGNNAEADKFGGRGW